jgi:hypothetical protein
VAEARAVSNRRHSASFIALSVFAVLLIAAATLMMFSRFMLYDDEGYVLFSLKNFAEHGRLYRDVYTQYGPLPYVFYYFLSLVGVPLNHIAGRLVTIGAWSGTALLSGAIVWRTTRSYVTVAATLAAEFVYLWVMVSEPTHPGGLVVLLTAILAAVGSRLLEQGRSSAWAALTGAVVAALVLTKINVGVFALISAGAFVVLNSAHPLAQRWSPWAISLGFAVLPFALMRPLLHAPWVQIYACIYAVGAAAVASAAAISRGALFGGRELRAFAVGGAIVALGVIGTVLARGTGPADLLQGVVLGPLRHPVSFSLVFKWAPGSVVVATISGVLFLVCRRLRHAGSSDRADTIVAIGRLLATAGLAAVLTRFPAISADNLVLAFGASCAWFFVWPLADSPGNFNAARTWIGLLLLGQFLHPFPVPGSQIAWGTFLTLPLAAIGAWEAAQWLARRFGLEAARRARWTILPRALVGALAGFLAWQLAQIGRQYFEGRTLTLPGAELIRLPDQSTARYQVLSFNALTHSDVLFSLPGMFSFNLWTGVPPPTLANVTHWFSLLTRGQQQAIIHELEQHPRATVIVETGHVQFLREHQLAPAGPLYEYIEREFTPAFAIDGFEFRVHRGRQVAPYFTAEVFTRPPSASATDAKRDSEQDLTHTRLVMPLLLPAEQPVATIEIVSTNRRMAPVTLRAEDIRLEVTPITLQGEPRGPTARAALPLALKGPALVAVYFDGRALRFDVADTLIVLRNTAGAELGLVRLRP